MFISHFNYPMISCNNAKKRKWQKYVIVVNGLCGHNCRRKWYFFESKYTNKLFHKILMLGKRLSTYYTHILHSNSRCNIVLERKCFLHKLYLVNWHDCSQLFSHTFPGQSNKLRVIISGNVFWMSYRQAWLRNVGIPNAMTRS